MPPWPPCLLALILGSADGRCANELALQYPIQCVHVLGSCCSDTVACVAGRGLPAGQSRRRLCVLGSGSTYVSACERLCLTGEASGQQRPVGGNARLGLVVPAWVCRAFSNHEPQRPFPPAYFDLPGLTT